MEAEETAIKSETSPFETVRSHRYFGVTLEKKEPVVDQGMDYCSSCDTRFDMISAHKALVHGNKTERRCVVCGQLYWKKMKLVKHLLKHANNSIKCWFCGESNWSDYDQLCAHLEEHPALHIYKCELCKRTFAVQSHYEDHLIGHTNPWKLTLHECPSCELKFEPNKGGLKSLCRHYLKEHKKLKCTICRKTFDKFIVFYNHFMRHSRKLPYECDECDLIFRKKSRLKEHVISTHRGYSQFVCDLCGAEFKHRPSHDAHVRSHDDSLCFTCNYCAKIFLRKVSLLGHFIERSCDICQVDFHCRVTFDEHFKEFHVTDKAFSCEMCVKSYMTENRLKRHVTLEHPEMRRNAFKCSVCPYETATLHNLNRHMRRWNHRVP